MMNMLSDSQIQIFIDILGDDKGYEICCNHNLRVRGHIEYDEFESMFNYCKHNDVVFTLGADGVLVLHD